MLLKKIGLVLGPLLFLIILLLPAPKFITPEAWKVMALAAFMITWWVTEAMPLPVTALLPIIFLPILGVSNLRAATAPYANPVVFLFMGGFMIALAMEKWHLHRRIALNIVKLVGTNANGIILGFFLATFFLSMWISNTATTVLMLPIALSVINLLTGENGETTDKNKQFFALGILLAITYAASIGGMGTVIGTPPNVVAAGYLREAFDYEVSFMRWLVAALPFSLAMLIISYLLIVKVMYRNNLGRFEGAEQLIKDEVKSLGKMNLGEKRTLIVFIGAALLWMLRVPLIQFTNWFYETILINNLQLFTLEQVGKPPYLKLSDEVIAIMAAVALFIIPTNFKKGLHVLEWRDTEKLPWGILLLFGGGLSLADALESTGIIQLIGDQFANSTYSEWLVVAALVTISVFLTEIMSNVAQVTVFLPVVGAMAQGLGMNPFEVCIPVTLAASAGFMLPMSTPPNAIVFASGHIKIAQMVKVGFWLDILSIILNIFIVYPLVKWLF
ncbi:MAG: DASS family sodium-coupled anion symporter [Saprospiraceae bacterium]|nr:DASS family sodium-coupled anion symporter [Saprospiraceae bacterium]